MNVGVVVRFSVGNTHMTESPVEPSVTLKSIMAVVVSYNGLRRICATVEALISQVDYLLIVDNGSGPSTLLHLEWISKRFNEVRIILLPENRGVAHALNLGVLEARQMGYKWILTMDQDTLVEPDFVNGYIEFLAQNPDEVCLTPSELDSEKALSGNGSVAYAKTSGTLVKVPLFDEIGPFDDGLFIDCIDVDFCLRLRRSGKTLMRVNQARMKHHLGEPIKLPPLIRRFYARHSPIRRYYMYRNFVYMFIRYFTTFPLFIAKLTLGQAILTFFVGLFDEAPMESFRLIANGLGDALLRRTGKYSKA